MKLTTKIMLVAALLGGLLLATLALDYQAGNRLAATRAQQAGRQAVWQLLQRDLTRDLQLVATATESGTSPSAGAEVQAAITHLGWNLQETDRLWAEAAAAARVAGDETDLRLCREATAATLAFLRHLADFSTQKTHLAELAETDPRLAAEFATKVVQPLLRDDLLPSFHRLEQAAGHQAGHTADRHRLLQRRTLQQAGALALAGEALLLGLTAIIYLGFVRPLRRMERTAGAIKLGSTHFRFGYHRRDELGVVATAFDEMLDRLHATSVSRDELEHLVAQRTSQLNLLSLVSAHTTNLIVITDAAGRIESVNAGFERLTGYTLAEVRGRKPGDFLQGPGTDPATVDHIRTHLRAGLPVATEILNYDRHRRPYWLQVNIQPVRDEAGHLTHFIAIESEITARRQAAAELESYRNRLDLALAAANTCTFDLDLVANTVVLDARWSVMLGGEPVETRQSARRLLDLVPVSERHLALRHIADCGNGRVTEYRIAYRVRHRDGTWRWIQSNGRGVGQDAQGRARRIIGTNTDITERKAAELTIARQVEFFGAMSQTTFELLERRHLPDLLQALVEQATTLLDAPFGEIMFKEGEALVLQAHTRNLSFRIGETVPRDQAPLVWQAHDSRQPAVTTDASLQPDQRPAYAGKGITAVADIPILLHDRCIGVIGLARTEGGQPFGAEDIRQAVLLSRLAALIVTNARIYEDALRAAESGVRALREREADFNALVEDVQEGYYVADRRGFFTHCNPALCAMSGYTAAELLGTSVFRLIIAADRPGIMQRYREWLRDPATHRVTCEFRVSARSGRTFWVEQSTAFVRDSSGHALEGRNMLRDITERKNAEAALRESEERFHAVFDQSPIAIALLSYPEGKIVELNHAAREAFGGSQSRAIGRTSTELNVWADPAERTRYLALLESQRAVHNFEARMRRSNGEVFPALYSGSLIRISGKTYSLNSIQDIAVWRQAEARFRDLFAYSPDAILISNQEGVIVDANQRAVTLFEYPKDHLVGRPAGVLMPKESRPALIKRLQDYLRKPHALPMGGAAPGLMAQTASGRRFPIDISLSPLQSNQGLLVAAAVRDISHELEAQARLRQAQKMESLGTLAGGIAHDFNNILTGLLGFIQIARLDLDDSHPASASLDKATASGSRAKHLVKQILTFSRKTEGETVPTRLQTVVSEALLLLRSTLPAMVELHEQIDYASPPVMADGTQLHQIVMNLCTNAWHALPEAGGRIDVGLAPYRLLPENRLAGERLPAGDYVQLTVRDNGHGMDSATVERIFEPFFTTKESGKGTGLGLAVVHGIVESHGGRIHVQSTVGSGTTFEILLPALAPSAAQPAADGPEPADLPRGRGRRVLLVDDDPDSLAALHRMIGALDYQCIPVGDPRAALELFQQDPTAHDLVVTDLAMPGLPGPALAEALLRLRPGLAVLLVSGFVTPAQQQEILGLGVRKILRKPPTMEEIATTLALTL